MNSSSFPHSLSISLHPGCKDPANCTTLYMSIAEPGVSTILHWTSHTRFTSLLVTTRWSLFFIFGFLYESSDISPSKQQSYIVELYLLWSDLNRKISDISWLNELWSDASYYFEHQFSLLDVIDRRKPMSLRKDIHALTKIEDKNLLLYFHQGFS